MKQLCYWAAQLLNVTGIIKFVARAFVAGLIVIAHQAHAIVLTEPPDFSFSAPGTFGTLDSGLNTATGNISCTRTSSGSNFGCFGGDADDVFTFDVAANFELISLSVDISNFVSPQGEPAIIQGYNPFNSLPFTSASGSGDTGNLLSGPQGPGSYEMRVATFTIDFEASSTSYDYTLSLVTRAIATPVPEPGTIVLMGLGLAGLLGLGRRQRQL